MKKVLFYNKFISCLYMFRAKCVHRQKVKIVLYSLWYHHTKTSEWSKITKITKITKIYKYEQRVVKFVWIFRVWLLCITFYKDAMTCRGYVYPVIKLIRKVLCLFTLHVCWVCLVIKSYKLLISCIYKVMFVWLLKLLKIRCLFTLPV